MANSFREIISSFAENSKGTGKVAFMLNYLSATV
jgi:hypothetical protein